MSCFFRSIFMTTWDEMSVLVSSLETWEDNDKDNLQFVMSANLSKIFARFRLSYLFLFP